MKLSENVAIGLSVILVAGLLVIGSTILRASEPSEVALLADSAVSEEAASDSSDGESALPGSGNDVETVYPDVLPGEQVSINALLSKIAIQDEVEANSYDRDNFKHWISTLGNNCDARDAVLKEESSPVIPQNADCPFNGGKWQSLYDDTLFTDPSKLDIDHMVPLKEAWVSGAHSWNDEKREYYANDRDDPRSLIAVSAKSNRSKSDQDPSEWMPPSENYWCVYISDWVAVKYRWQLSMQQAEYDTIAKISEDCDTLIFVPDVVN